MSKCDHKWTMYTPFRGEPHEVCANEGCKYTKIQYEQERIANYQPTDLRPGVMQTQFGDVTLGDDDYPYGIYGFPMGRSDNAPVDWNTKSKQIDAKGIGINADTIKGLVDRMKNDSKG